jgi:TolB-like protein
MGGQSARYNLGTLKFVRLIALLVYFSAIAIGQQAATAGQTVLVVPFENQSKAPGIEWIGDSFPELLQSRLNSPTLYVLPREDRLRAYDRMGIPARIRTSRATLYRMAEQMDVDYVVLGEYNFDGQTFSVTPNCSTCAAHVFCRRSPSPALCSSSSTFRPGCHGTFCTA